MKEILINRIVEKKYNKELERTEVVRIVHVYYDEKNKTIIIEAPLKVEHLIEIRYYLHLKNIEYKNIIVGRPDA